MRKTLRCPKCSGQKILAVDAVQDKNPIDGGGVLAVGAKAPWTVMGNWKNVGAFSCCVCAACGFVEWYIDEVASLPIDGKVVRVLSDNESDSTPYR
jgi:predicted nucleic-acid-binding Zn-ribbon protein